MIITPERLAAYAEGELSEFEERLVEHELARSPALRAQLEAHRARKTRVAGSHAPAARQPLRTRLVRATHRPRKSAEIIDLGQARTARQPPRKTTRWTWLLAPVLAGAMAVTMYAPGPQRDPDYASAPLARALDLQLAAAQTGDEPTRVLLSFRDRAGRYCRTYLEDAAAGIACRDAKGWRFARQVAAHGGASTTDGPLQELTATARRMISGTVLDAAEEVQARRRGWRSPAMAGTPVPHPVGR